MGGYLGIEATVELLRDHQVWVIALDAGAPFSGMAVGSRLLIGALLLLCSQACFDVNLCELDLIIGPPILVFQRNSTLQHYDAIEIIARAAENCVCMLVIVNDGETSAAPATKFSTSRSSSSTDRAHHHAASKESALCASATNRA
jgi:hypothetical protein